MNANRRLLFKSAAAAAAFAAVGAAHAKVQLEALADAELFVGGRRARQGAARFPQGPQV